MPAWSHTCFIVTVQPLVVLSGWMCDLPFFPIWTNFLFHFKNVAVGGTDRRQAWTSWDVLNVPANIKLCSYSCNLEKMNIILASRSSQNYNSADQLKHSGHKLPSFLLKEHALQYIFLLFPWLKLGGVLLPGRWKWELAANDLSIQYNCWWQPSVQTQNKECRVQQLKCWKS